MKRTFIQTQEFSKHWERLGLNDDDLRRLELDIKIIYQWKREELLKV